MLRKVKMTESRVHIRIDEEGKIVGRLPEGVVVSCQRPLEMTFENNAQVALEVEIAIPLQLRYVLEPFSNVQLVEIRDFAFSGHFQKETILKPNSQFKALFLNQNEQVEGLKIDDICHVQNDASLEVSYGELGDGQLEANYTYELEGEGASAHLYLAATARHEDRKHYQVTLNHRASNTYGLMENYGVTRHLSRLTFDGVGRILKGMHQSESHQTSRIIVFEPTCIAKANPYLYIDDYDVKASHAASVGAMNEEHLYYLQSRGLTKKQAMHLITMGYLLPAFKVFDDETLLAKIEEVLLRKVGE